MKNKSGLSGSKTYGFSRIQRQNNTLFYLATKGGEPTFQGFLLDDNDEEETSTTPGNSATAKPNVSADTGEPTASKDAAKPKAPKDTAKPESPDTTNQDKKSRSGRTIKPTEKAKHQNQELVAYLTTLLERDWESNPDSEADALLTSLNDEVEEEEEDPYKILSLRLLQANAGNPSQFVLTTQLDVEEPESYNRVMAM